MGILKRDQILAAKDLQPEKVHVDEWGGDVLVQPMTGARRIQFEQELEKNPNHFRQLLVIFTVVDERGELQFQPEDAPALLEKAYDPVLKLSFISARLSGVRARALEAAKENFTETPPGDSHSD